jgi:hypothetical protein
VEAGLDNPFLKPDKPEPTPDEPLGVDEFLGTALAAKGPSEPAIAGRGPASSIVLPRRELTTHPQVSVAGVHGGAGASTLAGLLGECAYDAGVCWPVAGGWLRPLPILSVVLVARTHGTGLAVAERAARAWAAGQLGESRLLGLVLIDDAPHLTKTQRAAARRLSLMTPTGWHISWQPQWRETAPDTQNAPARVRKTLADIRRRADPEAPTSS